jgi:hypothetical protein
MSIELTAEELECIREQCLARADEMEWQLRRELAHLREIAARMLDILGTVNAPGGTASKAAPALGALAARMGRLPPLPPPAPPAPAPTPLPARARLGSSVGPIVRASGSAPAPTK